MSKSHIIDFAKIKVSCKDCNLHELCLPRGLAMTDLEPHCRAEMDNLNMIAEDKDLPETIAVCMNDKEQREEFEFDFEPAFDIYQIPDDDFWRLLGDGEIPRTILINDGIVAKKWDFAPPEIDEIKTALGS